MKKLAIAMMLGVAFVSANAQISALQKQHPRNQQHLKTKHTLRLRQR